MMQKQKTIPIFVSHMGCPNDCSFCNQRKITGHSATVTPNLAENIIEEALKTIPETVYCEIAFFGGSFTGIEETLQEALLAVAKQYKDRGKVKGIRLSTRPDYIDEQVIARLKRFGVTMVELGAQSMCDEVLLKNHRGHTAHDTIKAVHLLKQAGISVGLQMMTGLWGDDDTICKQSANKMISLAPDCVRIYPTLVLTDTYLAMQYNQGVYTPQTLEQAVNLCADLKQMFDDNHIPVIRLGLLASDNISPEKDVVAGPFHPAFGELVQSELFLRKLKCEMHENGTVLVHPKSVSALIGNNRVNIKTMAEKGIAIQIQQDSTVPVGEIRILKQKGGRICG